MSSALPGPDGLQPRTRRRFETPSMRMYRHSLVNLGESGIGAQTCTTLVRGSTPPKCAGLCISDESLVESSGMSSRAAFFGCLLLACVVGCKQKSEEPPPLASATPEATLAPSAAPAPEAAPSATAAAESAEAGSAGHPALAAQGEEAAAARGADGDAGK
jgi:hypothetical protein